MDNFYNAPGTNDTELYSVIMSKEKARKTARRMTFLSIILIILGAFMCLSFIGIVVGIFFIIAGTKLYNTACDIKDQIKTDSDYPAQSAGENLTDFSKKFSIGMIVQIAFYIISIVYYISVLSYVISIM